VKRLVVIPARYGSIRLPGKPLREIGGKPLIQWVFEGACQSKLADDVIIATDDERVRDAAMAFGAPAVMTSPDLMSGTDRVWEATKGRPADLIVNVQGDEPQIRGDMIDTLFRALEEDRLPMATLVAFLSDTHDYRSPHTVKVVLDKNGFALYFSRAPIPFMQRTTAIPLFKHIGIYGFSRDFLQTFVSLPRGRLEEVESLEQLRALEAGYRIRALLVEYEGVGIDTEEDLERASQAMVSETTPTS
jgi:3-deoxy-manno-octulosonate cytidylyltransferase (CMP-KDO synthetase)